MTPLGRSEKLRMLRKLRIRFNPARNLCNVRNVVSADDAHDAS